MHSDYTSATNIITTKMRFYYQLKENLYHILSQFLDAMDLLKHLSVRVCMYVQPIEAHIHLVR